MAGVHRTGTLSYFSYDTIPVEDDAWAQSPTSGKCLIRCIIFII
jgi:hypothetical protein